MPPAEIVTGSLAQLEDALADAVSHAREASGLAPITVLVGHVLLRPYLRRALAQRGVAQLNVRFVRPNELARSMASNATSDLATRPKLTPGAERLLVREIADGAGGYFGGIAGREGFADALGRLFREIELGGFTPATFADALGGADDAGSKESELAALYAAYAARRAGFDGVAEAYAAAASATIEGPLFVYGLWQPSRVQYALIEQIARTNAVTVFLPASNLAADEAHEAFRTRLTDAGFTTRALESRAAGAPVALARVNDRLFHAYTPAPGPVAGAEQNVTLISAPDTVREVWEAARACLRWAGEGIRFHEMAVVYRNRTPYRDLVDEIFKEAQIDTYLHDGHLLASHPLGRRLLLLLELASDHETFARSRVMEFLTETKLAPSVHSAYGGDVRPSAWETYTREAGVVEGAGQWQQRLGRLAKEKRDGALADGYDWLEGVAARIETLMRFVAEFHAALAARPEEATWDEHLAYLKGLAAPYADGTEQLIEALEDLRTLAAVRERVPFDVFCRAVRDDLESRDTSLVLHEPVRMFGRQGVAVIDASSLRHLRFRAVCMLGVAERAWPPPMRPDPLLLEHERRRINDAAVGELPLRTEPDDEALGFWLGVQAPRERLSVSYARAAAGRSGKHLPSYFFRATAEALEGRRLTLDELDRSAWVRRFEAGRLASDGLADSLSEAEYDRGLIKMYNAGELPSAIEALAEIAPSFGRAVHARTQRRGATLTEYDGVMIGDEARAAALARSSFAGEKAVSASRLETYATCPYRYFLKYALGIEPVEEPEAIERMDHLQKGSLIHEILQKFLVAVGRNDPPRAERRAEHLALLDAIAQGAGDDRARRGVTGRPLIWKMDKRDIDEDLHRWYDKEVEYAQGTSVRPGAFEARFGPMGRGYGEEDAALSTDDPLVLRIGGRELRLQGRIDRIDWDDDKTRFRVIDYKTGKTKLSGTFARGTALQLPIYLHAAAQLLEMPVAQGESQYFYASTGGGFDRRTMLGADVAATLQPQFEQILETIADGVDGGNFAANPGVKRDTCKWCDYKDVCDARIDKIMDGKGGDERNAAYRAMGEIK